MKKIKTYDFFFYINYVNVKKYGHLQPYVTCTSHKKEFALILS